MPRKSFGLYLIIIVFFPPQILDYFASMEILSSGLAALRYLISFTAIGCMIGMKEYRRVFKDPYFLAVCFSVFFMIIGLCLNGSFYLTAGLACVTYMGFTALNFILFYWNKKRLFETYRNILIVYICIHFITLLIYPEGMIPGFSGDGRVYFLGSKNVITTYILLYFLTCYLSETPDLRVKKDQIKTIVIILLLNIITAVNGSATAILAVAFIDVFCLLKYFAVKFGDVVEKIQRIYLYISLGGIFGFFLLVIVMGGGDNVLMDAITSILGRDLTFSGRRAIWTAAINFIIQNPIWGTGLDVQYDVWGNSVYVYSAHNTILDYGVKYGCVSLLFWLISLAIIIRIAMKNIRRKDVKFSLTIFSALILASMFEAIEGFYTMWAITAIVYLIVFDEEIQGDVEMNCKIWERIRSKYFRVRDKKTGKRRLDFISKKPFENGIYQGPERKEKIIVSMASYAGRYEVLPVALKSLLLQKVKADKIIVWLDEDNSQNALTEELKKLQEYGVEFRFTNDGIKPHKKYLYAMKEFPNDCVITVDDDLIYSEDMIESLLLYHQRYPNVVCARRVHKITFSENGEIKSYNDWKYEYRDSCVPAFNLCATGGGGTLYPPNTLPKDAFDVALIKELCLDADDIWLKIMELKKRIKVVWVKCKYVMPLEVYGSQESSLNATNVIKKKNDLFLEKLIEKYPEVLAIMKKN